MAARNGTDTPNDRMYRLATFDFLSFGNRNSVIDHGQLQHLNNATSHSVWMPRYT